MSRIRKLAARTQISDEIPTSPMADIAFLLIIFFMLTMTFAASRGLDFPVPQDPEGPIDPVESVLVRVQVGGGLEVDGRPMQLGELLDYLAPKLQFNPEKPVIVAPAPDAAYGDFIAVYDTLRLAPEQLGLEQPIQIALPVKGVTSDFF